jgi:septum formation protein
METIILASQSPRRKQLLEWAELKFSIIVANTDEDFPATIPLIEVPVFIAKQKAKVVQEKISDNSKIIIAADTIVVLDNNIIGKPLNRQEAINSLLLLSNKTHQVITGVVITKGDEEISFSETTDVEFHELKEDQIEFYVDEYKPYDKAGGYAIQEWIGVVGIKKITGDFYNVMGLPISRVIQELEKF